jgi:hypothetical protein
MRTMRTIALIVGACVLAGLSVLAGLMWWLGWILGLIVTLGITFVIFAVYALAIGPWQRRWGATDEDVYMPMPGDGLLGPDAASTTRAVTVAARPDDIFPWLLQIGYGRGGWYSYDWIDNDGSPSADRIEPALQRLAVGDRIEMMPGIGPVVREIVPNHHIVSGGDTDSWCLLVEPMEDGRTRLLSRWRQRWAKTIAMRVWLGVVDPGAFLMEQKMLRSIRYLAEHEDSSHPTGGNASRG